MARTLGDKLKELQRIVRLHTNWFAVALLGRDAITEEELRELEEYGKLPLDEAIDFAKKSYILGRMRAVLKNSEYKNLNYEQVNEEAEAASFTTLEEYALQHVKLHAADGIKGLASDLAAGAFNRLKASMQDTLNEAAVRGIIRDRLALALIEKENSQKVASTLAKELKAGWSRDWRLVVETELHRAKMMGSAQAIVNKIDIYKNSDGADSLVSIVPSPTRCDDCGHHFLDSRGNPKVFRLSQLLDQGSNADPDVKHTRKNGKHNHWKTTLPPLHPRCGCRLVYVPKGMGWEDGKLQIIDENVYVEELKKAVDQGSMSATIKPPGPKSSQGPKASVSTAANPPSMSGAPAPSNTPGPGAPKQAGPVSEWEYYDGEGTPPSDGGWKQSESGAWRRPKGSGGKGGKATPEMEAQRQALKEQEAANWNRDPKPADVVSSHLSMGEISHTRPLSQEDVGETSSLGVNEGTTELVTIEGNGRGVMKPALEYGDRILKEGGFTEGCGTVPHGTHAENEADAYGYLTAMFGGGFCPVTVLREHDGQNKSVQQWAEDTKQAGSWAEKNAPSGAQNAAQFVLGSAADKQKLQTKMSDIVFGDIGMNNNDRHMGNLQLSFNDKGQVTDMVPVDHGPTAGNDFMGFKNTMAQQMHRSGFHIIPSEEAMTKARNMTMGDMQRAMPNKKDWQCAQQLLRTRYAVHLVETDGRLDYRRLQSDMFNVDGNMGPDPRLAASRQGIENPQEHQLNREAAHEQFEDFAIDYIDNAASDSSHPDHEFAKEWKEKGFLMGPGSATNPTQHREAGKHKDYEKAVRKSKAEADKRRGGPRAALTEAAPSQYDKPDPFVPTERPEGGVRIPTTSEALGLAPTEHAGKPAEIDRDAGTAKPKRKIDRDAGTAKPKIRKSFGLYLADPNRPFRG